MGADQHTITEERLACRPYCFPDIAEMRQAVESENTGRFTRMPAEGADVDGNLQPAAGDDAAQAEKRAFEAGYQQGHAAARAATDRELSTLIKNLQRALGEINRRQAELYRRVEEESVRLALAVARKIVFQELKIDPEIVVKVMRKAIEAVDDAHRLAVHMHPEDAALVRSLEEEGTLTLSAGGEKIRIEANDGISRGGCRIYSGAAELDATVESRLQVIESAFNALLPGGAIADPHQSGEGP